MVSSNFCMSATSESLLRIILPSVGRADGLDNSKYRLPCFSDHLNRLYLLAIGENDDYCE